MTRPELSGTGAGAPGVECTISSHALLGAFDRERAGLAILHQDLLEGDRRIVCSALAVLGRWREPRSVGPVRRLLQSRDEDLQAAAATCLGAIGDPASRGILGELLWLCRGDRVRCATLDALAAIASRDPSVPGLLWDCCRSRLGTTTSRARAARLLVKLEGAGAAERLLASREAPLVDAVYAAAAEGEDAGAVAMRHGRGCYEDLSRENRKLLVALAASRGGPDAGPLLLDGVSDADREVRLAAYRSLGSNPSVFHRSPEILLALSEPADPEPSLEEEALAAIERIEAGLAGSRLAAPSIAQRIHARIQDHFRELCRRDRRSADESRALGRVIGRSKEFVEYYADDDFHRALVLEGGAGPDRLLAMLAATADSVEDRHLEGYQALANLIRSPQRHDHAVVLRELASARLGGRETLCRLIRCLKLARLVTIPPDAAALYLRLHTWAREAKLYRLAGAALQALIGADAAQAADAGEACLTPPVSSTACAVAVLRQLEHLDWTRMESVVRRLLAESRDPVIQLSLIDALMRVRSKLCEGLVGSLLDLLAAANDGEVAGRLAALLGSRDDADLLDRVTSDFARKEPWHQELILCLVERRIAAGRAGDPGLIGGFLRAQLGSGLPRIQARAAVLLYKLDGDRSLGALADVLGARDAGQQAEIVGELRGTVTVRPARPPRAPARAGTHAPAGIPAGGAAGRGGGNDPDGPGRPRAGAAD